MAVRHRNGRVRALCPLVGVIVFGDTNAPAERLPEFAPSVAEKQTKQELSFPIALPLAFDVIAGRFQVLLDIAAVFVVANLKEHFDSYAP
jgi:hypothetical protein